MKKLSKSNRILILIAALLIIPAYFTPLWQISLWAPQYPEGLNMKIWIDHLSGNVDQINGVNHYIGMNHIGDEMFPEFTFLIYVIGGLIALGILAFLIGKRWSLYAFFWADDTLWYRSFGRYVPMGLRVWSYARSKSSHQSGGNELSASSDRI
ncbi:hypothetical protein [Algoriphagus boritolerans]|uniref:hypothetical protein n=1 Tax=Algoriphagus boritolerans TaxID=308111 RepID=UPI000A783937